MSEKPMPQLEPEDIVRGQRERVQNQNKLAQLLKEEGERYDDMIQAWREIDGVKADRDTLLTALTELRDMAEQRIDAEYTTDSPSPKPNDWMRAYTIADKALNKVGVVGRMGTDP